MGDLSENSEAYRKNAPFYEAFAQAEDAPGLVAKFLIPLVRGRHVMEGGIGTGKYIPLLAPLAASYTGIDQSGDALRFAAQKSSSVPVALHHGRLEKLLFSTETFDVVLFPWVLGTILNPACRRQAFVEARRVLKPHGMILCIENDLGGEFEWIRGRAPDLTRTRTYNSSLEDDFGMQRLGTFSTYFEFQNVEVARKVFEVIWSKIVAERVSSRRIEHRVVVYGCYPHKRDKPR
jgi:ubiquinone/menaquinone biosynthesis C-methylase UbiE